MQTPSARAGCSGTRWFAIRRSPRRLPEGAATPPQGSTDFQELVENARDVIIRVDAHYRRTYVSPSCQEVLGYSQAEMLAADAFDLVHPDDSEKVRAALRQLGTHAPMAGCLFRARHGQGHFIWAEARYRHLSDDGGLLAVLRDVSHRVMAEQHLAETNAKLATTNGLLAVILENMTQGVCSFDADHRLIACNRRYCEIYDFPPGSLAPGTALADIVRRRYEVGSNPNTPIADYLRLIEEHATIKGRHETLVTLANGRTVQMLHQYEPDGSLVSTHEDVTDRRRTEHMLHEAQKMAAVGRLTGGIGHDFNNLLQTIGTALEMVVAVPEVAAEPDLRQLVEDAGSAIELGSQLTQQLLSFSRKQILRPVDLCAHDVIRRMSSVLQKACGDAIHLEIEAADPPYACRIDASQFRSCLLNLIVNARDAMQNGGTLRITLDLATLDTEDITDVRPGRYVKIEIVDTGHGILPEHLSLVFEPFFTTKAFGTGAGLGLAQVHGFAHQSGGTVRIASVRAQGTTVTLLLPHHSAASPS